MAKLATKRDGLYVARSDFTVLIDGAPWNFRKGIDLVDGADPVMKIAPERFEPYVPKPRSYPGRVEQATAAPGEKRDR
jgi:hypothetical protein